MLEKFLSLGSRESVIWGEIVLVEGEESDACAYNVHFVHFVHSSKPCSDGE